MKKIISYPTNNLENKSSTFSYMSYFSPKPLIKTLIPNPNYWVPDEKCIDCGNCGVPFDEITTIHHCRSCGIGFCDNCSSYRKTVPSRGFYSLQRVCKKCYF